MTARVVRYAADLAVLLWSALLTLAGCVALAWMGSRVMLAVLASGGAEEAAAAALAVALVVDVAWVVAWAVRQRKKWAGDDRVWAVRRG